MFDASSTMSGLLRTSGNTADFVWSEARVQMEHRAIRFSFIGIEQEDEQRAIDAERRLDDRRARYFSFDLLVEVREVFAAASTCCVEIKAAAMRDSLKLAPAEWKVVLESVVALL